MRIKFREKGTPSQQVLPVSVMKIKCDSHFQIFEALFNEDLKDT